MNGIYNFEKYRTPYLDMEMLMERKRKKQKRRLMILSGVAAILVILMMMFVLYIISKESKEIFTMVYTMFAIYIVAVAVVMARFIMKGEYLWQQEQR